MCHNKKPRNVMGNGLFETELCCLVQLCSCHHGCFAFNGGQVADLDIRVWNKAGLSDCCHASSLVVDIALLLLFFFCFFVVLHKKRYKPLNSLSKNTPSCSSFLNKHQIMSWGFSAEPVDGGNSIKLECFQHSQWNAIDMYA